MFFTKKIIAAKIVIGGAVFAAAGIAAVAYSMSDPKCREKLRDCSDRMRDCKNRMCNRPSDSDDREVETTPTI